MKMDWMEIAKWIDQLNSMEDELDLLQQILSEGERKEGIFKTYDHVHSAKRELVQVFKSRVYGE